MEVFTEVIADIAAEFFIIRLNRGIKSLVYYYVVVQAQ